MPSQESQKRQIAYKLQIKDILNGTYHQQEGWQPNYLLTLNSQKVSRVNLIATIIEKTQDQSINLLLDDGTGQITVRIFEALKTPLPQVGDSVLIIAKIREFNQEKYLMPEIIKQIKNLAWIQVRRLELKDSSSPPQITEKEVDEVSLAPYENLLNLIKKIDQGDGVDIGDLVKKSTLTDCEELIENLLKEGEVFEISPGRIKILK